MKKSIFVFVLSFVITFLLIYFVKQREINDQVEKLEKIYTAKVEEIVNSISLGFFQWDKMYEAAIKNDIELMEKWLEEITTHYTALVDIEIVPVDSLDFDLYSITSENDKLKVLFKIFDDNATEFVKDKAVMAFLNAETLLESLGIDWLKISSQGIDFAFGLKCELTRPLVGLHSLLIPILIALLPALGMNVIESRTELRFEQRLRRDEEFQRKTMQAVLDLSVDLLRRHNDDSVYQQMLEKMIKTVPNAEGGTVLVKRQNRLFYVAAVGYDLSQLSKISLPVAKTRVWIKGPYSLKRKNDVLRIDSSLDPEIYSVLKTVGRIDEIMCNISVPIEVDGELEMVINFDNFSDENAFDERSISLGRLFANYLAVIFQRITFEKRIMTQQEEIEYLSTHDPLTGLANRRAFGEYGERLLSIAKREGKKVAVLFLDLSKFKTINDSFGHPFGDDILRIIGGKLERTVRQSDFVARFGGDEFVIAAYNCDEFDVNVLAEKIIRTIEEPIIHEGKEVLLSVNIGVAIYPRDGVTLDELIRLADVAMYHAKKHGRKKALTDEMS